MIISPTRKCTLALLFLIFSISSVTAQLKEGVLRVKFKEEKAAFMRTAKTSKSIKGVMKVGDTKIDKSMELCKASNITRVFAPAGEFEAKHKKYGLHLWYEVTFDKGVSVSEALSSFGDNEDILIVEPVHEKRSISSDPTEIVQSSLGTPTNDVFYDYQWHYENTGSNVGSGGGGTIDADIDLPEAWAIQTGSPDVIVAIIDGGIDVDHEDLMANMWINTGEIIGNGVDDDGNGYIDDVNGYNFGDDTGSISADSHGTHVGGTVAAVTNNNVGVAGVAGGNGSGDGVRLMSCEVFGLTNSDGFDESFIYAADNGAVIAQNSWGYISAGYYDQSVLDAIDYFIAEAGYDASGNPSGPMQGGIVIFAAGNDGTDDLWYPGYYDPVLSVGATDLNDAAASYSNRGDWVDIAAPGTDIASTSPGGYAYSSGTSMACPHVSGVAALIVSQYANNITPDEVWDRLVDNADPLAYSYLGSGRLNAYASLTANSTTVFPDPTKTYYIDNERWNVRIGADGSQDAFTTSIGTTGDNVEWTITESPTAGYYYIDCVGGGSAPRIRSDQNTYADMQATSSAGSWTRWSFTDAGDDEYYLSTLYSSDYMRLRVNASGELETVASSFTGTWTHFSFTEAGNATSSRVVSGDAEIAASSLEVEERIMLYPVPVTNTLNLSLPSEGNFVTAQIINLTGTVSLSQGVSSDTDYQIDVSGLSKGIHFVRLVRNDGSFENIKFVK